MQTNKELKIAIIVGAIMVTTCILAFMYFKSSNSSNNYNQVDIKVYKANDETQTYEPCQINTETLIQLNSELKRAYRLTDSNRVIGKTITGRYRVASGDDFIAFDEKSEENYIYRGDTKYLYEFDSDIYDLVVSACK